MATLIAVLSWAPEEREVRRASTWQVAGKQDGGTDPLQTFCVLLMASGVLSYGLAVYQLLLRPL